MPWLTQEITLPLSGDDAAVRNFAQKVDALKKKVRCSRRALVILC